MKGFFCKACGEPIREGQGIFCLSSGRMENFEVGGLFPDYRKVEFYHFGCLKDRAREVVVRMGHNV